MHRFPWVRFPPWCITLLPESSTTNTLCTVQVRWPSATSCSTTVKQNVHLQHYRYRGGDKATIVLDILSTMTFAAVLCVSQQTDTCNWTAHLVTMTSHCNTAQLHTSGTCKHTTRSSTHSQDLHEAASLRSPT